MDHRRMVKMKDGSYEEYQLALFRLEADNPRSGQIIFEDDSIVELSENHQQNHFITIFIPVRMIPKLKKDDLFDEAGPPDET